MLVTILLLPPDAIDRFSLMSLSLLPRGAAMPRSAAHTRVMRVICAQREAAVAIFSPLLLFDDIAI